MKSIKACTITHLKNFAKYVEFKNFWNRIFIVVLTFFKKAFFGSLEQCKLHQLSFFLFPLERQSACNQKMAPLFAT